MSTITRLSFLTFAALLVASSCFADSVTTTASFKLSVTIPESVGTPPGAAQKAIEERMAARQLVQEQPSLRGQQPVIVRSIVVP